MNAIYGLEKDDQDDQDGEDQQPSIGMSGLNVE